MIHPVRLPASSSKMCLIFETILFLTLYMRGRMFLLHFKLLKHKRLELFVLTYTSDNIFEDNFNGFMAALTYIYI